MQKTYSVTITSKKFSLVLIGLIISIACSLILGIILGRSYYASVSPAIYPLIFIKEFVDGKYEFGTYLNREIGYFFSPPQPQNLTLKLKQNVRDNLGRELENIASNGNRLGDLNKNFYQVELLDEQGSTLKGRFRLKGNLPGHRAKGYFPSINVKLKGAARYFGVEEFSVQNPGERQWLWETVSYKLLQDQGVIAPQANFVELTVNDVNFGIHLFTERLTKRMLERNSRRYGPVIEIENTRVQNHLDYSDYDYFRPSSMPSVRSMFKNNDETLLALKSHALKNMELYLLGQKTPESVFDLDLFAKYLAAKDLLSASEVSWDEIKWYYNPLTKLLEPIDFDMHAGIARISAPLFIERGTTQLIEKEGAVNQELGRTPCQISLENGSGSQQTISIETRDLPSDCSGKEYAVRLNPFFDRIVASEIFQKAYFQSLERISRPDFIENFFTINENFLKNEDKILRIKLERRNTDFYNTIKTTIEKRAQLIRKILSAKNVVVGHYSNDGRKLVLTLANLNTTVPVNLKQVSLKQKKSRIVINEILPALSQKKIEITPVDREDWDLGHLASESLKKRRVLIDYSAPGLHSTLTSNVSIMELISPEEQAYKFLTPLNAEQLVKEFGATYRSASQEIELSSKTFFRSNYIISGLRVVAGPGSLIGIADGAKIEFHGGVSFQGAENADVNIISLDGTGAILFFGSKEETNLSNVNIQNFNLAKTELGGSAITSPITFYKTNFNLARVLVENVHAEDSINIVSSRGNITDLQIRNNNLSDCLDVDFSNVEINSVMISNCGNDGLDFSFSSVVGHDIQITNVGDKLISLGEATIANLSNVAAGLAPTGVAVKDGATMFLSNSKIFDVDFGVVLYNKKSGFSPASASVTDTEFKDVKLERVATSGMEIVTIDQIRIEDTPKFPENLIN
ncbi:CotH kinase family protein [Alphaproteobacteria bacterium]|nr:CotH kinase family protein [Alphaproteobacteria bacterium]